MSGRRDDAAERRDLLLRSIEDLDRELEAGELDPQDYRVLRDDYTARAAAAIREVEAAARRPGLRAGAQNGSGPLPRRILLVGGLALGAVAVGIAASSLLAGEDEPDIPTLLAEADECMQEDDVECAVDAYDRVLEQDPDQVEALAYRAALIYRSGETEEALAGLDRAIEIDPTFVDAWGFRVVILEQEGRLEEALDEIRELSGGGDGDVGLAVVQQVDSAASDPASGIEPLTVLRMYEALIEGDPDEAAAHAYRGWLFGRLAAQPDLDDAERADLREQALSDLERAVEIDPTLPDAHVFRAVVLNQMGRTEEAAEALRTFDSLEPVPSMQQLVDSLGLRDELSVPSPEG